MRLDSPLLVLLSVGLPAIWWYLKPSSRIGRRMLLTFVAVYWFLSTWLGAGLLVAGLSHGFQSIKSREAAQGADTIVVLGGGANTFSAGGVVLGELAPLSALRALEAARVYKLIGARLVVASGGIPFPESQLKPESEMLRDALVSAGVPDDRILEESTSRTTREEALVLKLMLNSRGVERFVLVTSPTHMRRAMAIFQAEGLHPIPSVSQLYSDNVDRPPMFLPSSGSRYLSDIAVYDYAATLYYWLRGWTTTASR
jgi:uncharacterized SAM-binding protein YcdF (DUF218 family)